MKNTKLPLEKWMAFTPAFIDGLSCDKTAERVEVTHKTAWFMRIRVLEALYRNLPSFQVKEGCGAYIDEFYLHESFKGVSFKHLGEIPREARHSSKDMNIRGISNEQICIVTGINDAGDFFYDIPCRGSFTREAAKKTLKDRLESGSIINTDKHHSYQKVVTHICGATHVTNGPEDHSSLKPVNNLHSAIKNFLHKFNGVSTKWLHAYMVWYKWKKVFKVSGHKIEDLLKKQISLGGYEHSWSSINKMGLPFRDSTLNAMKY